MGKSVAFFPGLFLAYQTVPLSKVSQHSSLIFTLQWMFPHFFCLSSSAVYTVLCWTSPKHLSQIKMLSNKKSSWQCGQYSPFSIIRPSNCISDVLWHFEKRANGMGELQWQLDIATHSGRFNDQTFELGYQVMTILSKVCRCHLMDIHLRWGLEWAETEGDYFS